MRTHDKINLENYSDEIKQLSKLLSVSTNYSTSFNPESIMEYNSICEHDDGYLCECRLKFILDWITEKYVN